MLRQVAALIEGALPLIGSGGIHRTDDALAMLDAGAVACRLIAIWKIQLALSAWLRCDAPIKDKKRE
jgi:dihydroorotate dehydrogenase